MAEYEEYDEYEDEEYEDDEYEDEEYEDEYEDEEYDDRYYGRRYEEDFDAVSVEPQVKTAIGIDGFAIIFSFIILLLASFLLARYSLYEIYDESFLGVIPPKEIPDANQKFNVIKFGCDKSISDVYNYAIIDAGSDKGIEPGLILYMGNPAVAKETAPESGGGSWGICMVVTNVDALSCRADVVRILAAKKDKLANAARTADSSDSDSKTGEWKTLATMTELMENLNWILTDETIVEDLKKVHIAKWNNDTQWILKKTEDVYSTMKRVKPEKK